MIGIKNLRYDFINNINDVIVDRRSVLGNPYRMYDESQRDRVCELYNIYFNALVNNNKKFLRENNISKEFRDAFMNELNLIIKIYKKYNGINLWCWCAPKRCHCETIKNYILGFK